MPGSEAAPAIEDNIFAEVNIPHHTDTAVCCFICHIFGKPNHEPALVEMMILKDIAPWIHENFKSVCKEVDYDFDDSQ